MPGGGVGMPDGRVGQVVERACRGDGRGGRPRGLVVKGMDEDLAEVKEAAGGRVDAIFTCNEGRHVTGSRRRSCHTGISGSRLAR